MTYKEALAKTTDLLTLFRPLLDLEEVLNTAAVAETRVKEMGDQVKILRKEVESLSIEKKKTSDWIKKVKEDEQRSKADRLSKIEEEVKTAENSAKGRAGTAVDKARAAEADTERITEQSKIVIADQEKEVRNLSARIAFLNKELAGIKNRLEMGAI